MRHPPNKSNPPITATPLHPRRGPIYGFRYLSISMPSALARSQAAASESSRSLAAAPNRASSALVTASSISYA